MFKVTITEITKETVTETEYKIIGEEKGEPKYGYVKIPTEKLIEKQLYQQTVEKLDIEEVIKAVNGMG